MRSAPLRPAVAVLLPGTGSDHVFVASVFAEPLSSLGIRLATPPPLTGVNVVSAMVHTLDSAGGGVLVGGVSLGAHVAASWAVRNPGRCAGLLLALPGWVGDAGDAPAALAARTSADAVRRDGLDRTLAAVRAGSGERWVADEVARAWRGHGDALPDALDTAAATPAPTEEELRRLAVPAGLAALSDDPLHPHAVAERWARWLPTAALVTTSLRAMRRDRATLGRAAVLAWLRAASC